MEELWPFLREASTSSWQCWAFYSLCKLFNLGKGRTDPLLQFGIITGVKVKYVLKEEQKQSKHSTICCCSVAQSCPTLCNPMGCSMPGFSLLHCLPEFAQTHVHWVSDAIQPFHPLSPSSPALNLSQHQGLFQWVGSLHQVAKLLEFQLQHQPVQWILGLIFFRIVWLDLLAVQETLKSLLRHQSLKASILWCSVFSMVQLAHPCMTTIVMLHKKWSPTWGSWQSVCIPTLMSSWADWFDWITWVDRHHTTG